MDRASAEASRFCGELGTYYSNFRNLPCLSNIVFRQGLGECGNGGPSSAYDSIRQHYGSPDARNSPNSPIKGAEQIRIARHAAGTLPEDFTGGPDRGLLWDFHAREYQTRIVGLGRFCGDFSDSQSPVVSRAMAQQ